MGLQCQVLLPWDPPGPLNSVPDPKLSLSIWFFAISSKISSSKLSTIHKNGFVSNFWGARIKFKGPEWLLFITQPPKMLKNRFSRHFEFSQHPWVFSSAAKDQFVAILQQNFWTLEEEKVFREFSASPRGSQLNFFHKTSPNSFVSHKNSNFSKLPVGQQVDFRYLPSIHKTTSLFQNHSQIFCLNWIFLLSSQQSLKRLKSHWNFRTTFRVPIKPNKWIEMEFFKCAIA